MDASPTPGDPRRLLERALVALALVVFAAAVLWRAPGYVGGDEPVGDDASSHVLASARVAEYLRTGSGGWWMPDLNLGFPLAHYYQPLPHVATGALALVLGGPERAAQAYKLLVVALLVAAPFASYLGLRRLGFARVGAVCGAVALATLSAPKAYYGLTPRHYLLSGLYTLLWGSVFAPLALGEGVRYLQGRGRLWLATGAFALLFLAHALLALGLVLVFTLAALLAAEGEAPLRARLTRLVLLGAATFGAIAFWLVPQLVTSDYFGGWPISRDERADGFGLAILADWMRGLLTDFRRPPVVALASLVGCVAACVTLRRATSRIVLAGVLLFVVFCAGRVTFGPVLDWVFPPNARIEGMMRWVAMLHLFLALAAGLGAQALVELAARGPRWLRTAAPAIVVGVLLALVVPDRPRASDADGAGEKKQRPASYVDDLRWGLDTFPEQEDRASYLAVAERLRAEPQPGRVYTAEPVRPFASHWAMAHLALLTGKPMTLSYGVGVQDSLNFFFLWGFGGDRPEVLVLDKLRAAPSVELLNVRYLLARNGFDGAYLGAVSIARAGNYEVLRLPGEYGYFDVVDPPEVLADTPPALARARLERWMRDEYPRGARFLRLPRPVQQNVPGLPAATLDFRDAQVDAPDASGAAQRTRPGRVLEEEAGSNRYRARVSVEAIEAWALLKVTPHPWWRAEVDGTAVPVYYLSPAFQGVPLGPGQHDVVFAFHNPGWQKLLLVLAPLLVGGLAALDLARRRTRA